VGLTGGATVTTGVDSDGVGGGSGGGDVIIRMSSVNHDLTEGLDLDGKTRSSRIL